MLPLSLLKTAQNHPMCHHNMYAIRLKQFVTVGKKYKLVELKNGETYNGHLVVCDCWMNINLRDVICTSRDGETFWRMPECYIRGSTIKYIRIPDEVIDMMKDDIITKAKTRDTRGPRGGRGRGGMRGSYGGRGKPQFNKSGSVKNITKRRDQ